jgi:hypothetical protein
MGGQRRKNNNGPAASKAITWRPKKKAHNLRNPARVLSLIYITYIGGKPELSSTTWDSIRVERKKAHTVQLPWKKMGQNMRREANVLQ